jgi:hypothetical protein
MEQGRVGSPREDKYNEIRSNTSDNSIISNWTR